LRLEELNLKLVKGLIHKMCEFCDRQPETPRRIEKSKLISSLGDVASYISKAAMNVFYKTQSSFYNQMEAYN